jgi:hypothetical protein
MKRWRAEKDHLRAWIILEPKLAQYCGADIWADPRQDIGGCLVFAAVSF